MGTFMIALTCSLSFERFDLFDLVDEVVEKVAWEVVAASGTQLRGPVAPSALAIDFWRLRG